MVGAAVALLGSETAEASGGRLEAARASTTQSAATAPSGSHAARPVRTQRRFNPNRPYPYGRVTAPRRTRTTTHVVTYRVVRGQPQPVATPAPQPLGPAAETPRLNEAPARPPFRRYAHRYPYEARTSGWVSNAWKPDLETDRAVAGRATAEGSYLFGGLVRSGFSARFGSPRVQADTQLSSYLDLAHRDTLFLGDTSLSLAPIALPQIVWRVGVGARYMFDARFPPTSAAPRALGWNMSTGVDVFPGAPFVLSARVDRGQLGVAPVWRARATAGLIRKRFELFAGYDHTQIDRVALGGPLLGLRAWL
ncbi:MAG: hypothetical protein AAF799_12155 [Myxococcota bacterium]